MKYTGNMQWLLFPFLPMMVASMTTGLSPLTDELLGERLYTNIIVGKYDNAVTQSVELETDNKAQVISQVVDRLLRNKKRQIMDYAYQLWIDDEAKHIVVDYLPVQFKLIVDKNYVELVHKGTGDQYVSFMSGDESTDVDLNTWQFIPLWQNNRVYFKFKSIECNLYTYLWRRDHATYGSVDSDTIGHQWYLQPVKHENDVMFFLFNREFNEALEFRDVNGDGVEEGHGDSNNVEGRPDAFGWFVVPSDHKPGSYDCLN